MLLETDKRLPELLVHDWLANRLTPPVVLIVRPAAPLRTTMPVPAA